MKTKRYTKDGLVIRHLAKNATPVPPVDDDDDKDWVVRKLAPEVLQRRAAERLREERRRAKRPRLTLGRNELVQALLAEIERGNSLTKLYATMLVREILADDPQLARKYRHQLDELEE